MITKIILKNFKRFKDTTVKLHPKGVTILTGGNNSGKSSLLQAISIWSFCKLIVETQKGKDHLYAGKGGTGSGINIDDFTPLNIPSLDYLWTNLKVDRKYSLSIECHWDDEAGNDKFLSFVLSLVQERLFIKQDNSNLNETDKIPNVVYIPPFAGIEVREEFYPHAKRRKLLGKGLSGAVLRNEILELYNDNIQLRKEKKGTLKKIKGADLKWIRENDPYERLQRELFEVFKIQLYPAVYNPSVHTYLSINMKKGERQNNRFAPFPNYKARDLMTEGSGFLQWLSVYTYALSKNNDILLLDEPDAHLHCTLQKDLINRLSLISEKFNKQILIATHATEVIKSIQPESILKIERNSAKYLTYDNEKIPLMINLGAEYCPLLDKIKEHKRLLFVENDTDAEILKIWAEKIGKKWPSNLVISSNRDSHSDRRKIFDFLTSSVGELRAISLKDRDTQPHNDVNQDLSLSGRSDFSSGNYEFRYRCWQRHEIENYTWHPEVIARIVSNKRTIPYNEALTVVNDFFRTEQGLTFPADFQSKQRSHVNDVLFDKEGHQVESSIASTFGISKKDIAKEMTAVEVFDDIKTFINELIAICS